MRTPILGGDRRATTVETATGAEIVDAGSTTTVSGAPHVADAAAAYEQGRADAHRADAAAALRDRDRVATVSPRRRGSPILALIVGILALIGAAWIYLSIAHGSAQQGGAVVDHKLSAVTAPAREAVDNVRNTTGQAVENAGAALTTSGERIKK